MLYAILKPIAVALMRLLFRLEAVGQELVPATGPVLIVSNHVSVLDPPLVGGSVPRPVYFMAKEELFRIPLFGRLIAALNARPVRRDGSDMRALKGSLALLQEGRAILVFPEGTRGVEGEPPRAGRPGVGMLAVLSGAPVVPVYVSGSGAALPRGRALQPGEVRALFAACEDDDKKKPPPPPLPAPLVVPDDPVLPLSLRTPCATEAELG